MDKHVSHCYTDGQLTEAIDGEMDASGNDKMHYHLATCGDCAERMRENVELEHFVSSLLKPIGSYIMVCSNLDFDFSGK